MFKGEETDEPIFIALNGILSAGCLRVFLLLMVNNSKEQYGFLF